MQEPASDPITLGDWCKALCILVIALVVVRGLAWLSWEYDEKYHQHGGIGVWLGGFDEHGNPER